MSRTEAAVARMSLSALTLLAVVDTLRDYDGVRQAVGVAAYFLLSAAGFALIAASVNRSRRDTAGTR